MARTADDDLYERPPGPRPSEVRAVWAREGDVENLWNVLENTPWDRIDREEVLRHLARALEVQSKADPALFAADVMSRMTVFATTLLMRCHLHLAACVEQDGRDRRMRAHPPGDLPENRGRVADPAHAGVAAAPGDAVRGPGGHRAPVVPGAEERRRGGRDRGRRAAPGNPARRKAHGRGPTSSAP